MINSIKPFALEYKFPLVCFLLFSFFSSSQEKFQLIPDSSYSRNFILVKNKMYIASSKNGVIKVDLKSKNPMNSNVVLIPPTSDGEFRDLELSKKGVYSITSGNNGAFIFYSFKTKKCVELAFFKDVFLDDLSMFQDKFVLLGDPSIYTNTFFLKFGSVHSPVLMDSVLIPSKKGEACYAGSGTTGKLINDSIYVFVSGGGISARFHRVNLISKKVESTNLPMQVGEGAGPFSLSIDPLGLQIRIVGGNYLKPFEAIETYLFFDQESKIWMPQNYFGYCCSIAKVADFYVVCGTSGAFKSSKLENDKDWNTIFTDPCFHANASKKELWISAAKGTFVRWKLKDF